MWQSIKQHAAAFALIVFAGCGGGGGGCSGCACGGMEPLQSGFPVDERIDNAASLRLTDSGVTFLNDNLDSLVGTLVGGGTGVVEFPIDSSNGSQLGIDYFVCEDGPMDMTTPPECIMEIDVGSSGLVLTTEPDHNIRIAGPLPIRLQKLPMRIEYFCIPGLGCAESNLDITITDNQACPGETSEYVPLDVDANISIEIDPDMSHVRYGYSRAKIDVTIDEEKLGDSIRICGNVDAGIFNSLVSLVSDLLVSQVTDLLDEQIEDAVCEQANPDAAQPCPDGTSDVDGVCRYGTDSGDPCVSPVLGVEGTVDLTALLGASGAFDLTLAAGGVTLRGDGSGFALGDLNPINGGASLSMHGGLAPAPLSGCVPPLDVAVPSDIPVPDALLNNKLRDWPESTPGPHIGFALSGRFLNYALAQLQQSGGLCLGIGPDTIPQLNSGLLQIGIGAPSMVELGRQKASQPAAIVLRPQTPPVVVLGDGTNIDSDPLLDISLERLALDFYIWSLDRYVRMFTATFDVHATMNLEVDPDEGIQPVIGTLSIANGVVDNHDLLRDDPEAIALALEDLVGGLVGDALGGALPSFSLNDALADVGLELTIPPTVEGQGSPGLRKLTQDGDDFIGIFAALEIPATTANFTDTDVEVLSFHVDPAGHQLSTWTRDNGPRIRLALGTTSSEAELEYQYRLDRGLWHAFVPAGEITVREPWLRALGRHRLEVRARRVGDPASLDPTPAVFELVVDPHAPSLSLSPSDGDDSWLVTVADQVSDPEAIMLRYRTHTDAGTDEWSPWRPAIELSSITPRPEAVHLEVQARDENENVSTVTQAIIRGRASGEGCECAIDRNKPRDERSPAPVLAFGAALVAALRRARRGVSRRVASRRP